MNYKKYLYYLPVILCLSFLLPGTASAISGDSCRLRISLLTYGAGEDLYSAWGHSGVRVYDSTTGGDYVFNYGTFDFSAEHFYWNFIRGKLLYYLSVDSFSQMMAEYQAEQRSVQEQTLNLSCAEREAIWDFLQTNYLPENRGYKYDFLYDNCSTRIRDIFARVLGNAWKIPDILPKQHMTFRELFNQYLDGHTWALLGITLLLGRPTDVEMNNWQAMFLPDYLMKGAALSSVNRQPLVQETRTLYQPPPVAGPAKDPFFETPLFWFSLLAILVLMLSFSQGAVAYTLMPWVDRCLFFLTGLLGCFMLFMWLGTDHHACAQNWNLLWAFPGHLVFSFFTQRTLGWVKKYALFMILLNTVLLLCWFLLPQQLPLAMLPVVLIEAVRAYRIYVRTPLEVIGQ